jgi:GNAT superfamily N-acetyltransferase
VARTRTRALSEPDMPACRRRLHRWFPRSPTRADLDSSIVVLELIERRRGRADRYSWTPFEPSEDFNHDWWDRPPYGEDDPWYVQALRAGDEVGRVKFQDRKMSLRGYGVDPQLAANALDIGLLEVSGACRREGIGRQIVRGLEAQYPDRTLVAFSEQADHFWASLGWDRYAHLTRAGNRTLFVQR